MFLPLQAPRARGVQIVATLGPASEGLAPALARAGATSFRFNASHLSTEDLRHALGQLRQTLPDAPCIVDLQGAKMRLGHFQPHVVRAGDRVLFSPLTAPAQGFPLPHPELFRAAGPGDLLTADDGRLTFRVVKASPEALEALALEEGVLKPRKGVNLAEHPVSLEDLTTPDREACDVAGTDPLVAFAFSFMKDGSEAGWLRRRLPDAVVVGKVERREATESLPGVASAVDALWICRGDLGEQLGPAALARFVATLDPKTLSKPVLMAGQVLEHLTKNAAPTRSEICHLFDLLARGYAGIVLSDETAIGEDPVGVVETAARLFRDFQA